MDASRTWRRSPTPEGRTVPRVWKPQPKARLWAPTIVPGRVTSYPIEGSEGEASVAEVPGPVHVRTKDVKFPTGQAKDQKSTPDEFQHGPSELKAGNSVLRQTDRKKKLKKPDARSGRLGPTPAAGTETALEQSEGASRPAPRPLDDEAAADVDLSHRDFASPCAASEAFLTPQSTNGAEMQWELLEAVQPFAESIQASRRLKHLMGTASSLSLDVFGDDALATVTRKGKWQLNMIACLDDDWPTLLGFVVYRVRPELQSLSIAKMVVAPEHRRKGHGSRLIESCVGRAQQRADVCFLALSSLPEAVAFYQRLGFRRREVQSPLMQEDFVEGQVYMEKPVKGRAGRRKTGR